jgi:hypothetical protein
MNKTKEYLFKCSNNKFGSNLKSCGLGQFCLSKEQEVMYIHIYYEGTEVLKLFCYKNPYFIAQGILKSNVKENVATLIEYLNQGLVPGLDFIISEKGIYLRVSKE